MHHLKVTLFLLLFCFTIPAFSQDSTKVFSCGFDESELDLSLLKNIDTRNFKVSEDGFYSARIAIDIDYDTYSYFGFNEELIRFELNKMFQKVSLLYEKEINTKLTVSEVHIWKSENEDPYKNEIDIFRMLSILRENAVINKVFSQDFDFYMYLPTKNFLGAGGLASGSGNVSPWGRYSTIAHEIGHNFGSPHTQSCSWENGPLDYCYPSEGTCYENVLENSEGTVMSYCSYIKSTFHPKVRDLIRAYASQYLRFIDNIPNTPVLNNETINSFNVPYISFKPVAEADKYYYEVASNSSFENTIFADTISFSSIYFSEYNGFDQYYVRVKAINQKGASEWSNSSRVIREQSKLAVPIPETTFNKKYIDLSKISSERLNFSAVPNAQGYEIELYQYTRSFIPVRDYFSYEYKSSTNSISLLEVTAYFRSDLMWRVRAYNGENKSLWSEFQYIFNKTEELNSNFNLSRPLPTSFTVNKNDNYETSNDYILHKIENNQLIEIPEASIQKEKNRFIFLKLDPNSTYKLTSTVSMNNHDIWEEKKPGFQYTFEKILSTSNESLPNNWQLFPTKDSTTALHTYSRKFSSNFMFMLTSEGLLRYNSENNEHQIFNVKNTDALIGNQIHLMEVDNEGNLWLLQRVSKRLDFTGVFPNPVFSLMKFNSATMELLERTDFEHPASDYIFNFDPQQMIFTSHSKLFKIVNGKLEVYFDISGINDTSSQFYCLGFHGGKYWIRRSPNGSNYTELLAVHVEDKSVEIFNYQKYANLPFNFNYVFFDEIGNPLIFNSENNKVLKLQDNQFITEADLSYPGSVILNPSYNKGIFTARIYSFPGDGIFKFYNNQWNKVSAYPIYMYAFYENFIDPQGNVWLYTYNSMIKVDVCGEIAAPEITAETKIDFGNPTTISVSGCTDVSWSFSDLSGAITDNSPTSKTFIPNSSFSYQVSCNDGGCISKNVEGRLAVLPQLFINSAVSNMICSNGEVHFSPTIQGQYPADNQFNLVLSTVGQSFKIMGNSSSKGPYFLNGNIPAGSYWSKLQSTNPQSVSKDSILINIMESSKVDISGVADICNGELGNLTATITGNGPFTYEWATTSSEVLSTDKNFQISDPGNYNFVATDANGCTSFTESILSQKINLSGEMILANGPLELTSNQTVELRVRNNSNWMYQWKINNEPRNFGSRSSIIAREPGAYTVEIKEASCSYETQPIELKQILASENSSWLIQVSPNPANEHLDISSSLMKETLTLFQLYNINGVLVDSWESSLSTQTIDISKLPSGLYLLHTKNQIGTYLNKFIK